LVVDQEIVEAADDLVQDPQTRRVRIEVLDGGEHHGHLGEGLGVELIVGSPDLVHLGHVGRQDVSHYDLDGAQLVISLLVGLLITHSHAEWKGLVVVLIDIFLPTNMKPS